MLERDRLGAVDTGSTTAHLTYVTDWPLPDLVSSFGKEVAGLVWQAGLIAIDVIEGLARDINIAFDFRRVPGFWHLPLAKGKTKHSSH